MFLIEDKNFLNEKQKYHIDNTITNYDFPWFYQKINIYAKPDPFLSHTVLKRIEYREGEEFSNSTETDFCINILNLFCNKHKIKYKEILRIAFNLTFNNGSKKSGVHVDHEFDHKQLIVYLNDCDKKSYTVIKDNKKEIKIKPEKFKGVCFDSKPHYQVYPKDNVRFVLIITFR